MTKIPRQNGTRENSMAWSKYLTLYTKHPLLFDTLASHDPISYFLKIQLYWGITYIQQNVPSLSVQFNAFGHRYTPMPPQATYGTLPLLKSAHMQSTPTLTHPSDFCRFQLVLSVRELHVNGIMQNLLFLCLLLSTWFWVPGEDFFPFWLTSTPLYKHTTSYLFTTWWTYELFPAFSCYSKAAINICI